MHIAMMALSLDGGANMRQQRLNGYLALPKAATTTHIHTQAVHTHTQHTRIHRNVARVCRITAARISRGSNQQTTTQARAIK